jgi:YidC/Oxa1 family membrane protein insertase
MENLRLVLLFALGFILLLLWQAWNEDYGQKQQAPAVANERPETPATPSPAAGGVPSTPQITASNAPSATVPATPTAGGSAEGQVAVTTDLFTLDIDLRGGSILNLLLNDYPVSLEQQEQKFQLLKPSEPGLFVAQSGLIGAEGSEAPTHESVYRASGSQFVMEDGKDSLSVDLNWTGESGIEVTKRFTFTRGSYRVRVDHEVRNAGATQWSGREYRQLVRGRPAEKTGSSFIYTYTGGAIYSPEEKYEKISFDDMDESKLSLDVTDGWIAMLQHYFLAAWVPPTTQEDHFYSNVLPGGRYVLGAYTPSTTLSPAADYTFSSSFVAGPKLQDELEAIAPGLELSVDYGWLTVIAKPIFWLLKQIQSVVGNWGWSIILLTLIIKLVFFKLSETSYKSMANMRKMTPRIQALKDRYGDDKQRLNQAMMDLYKKEKINPLGGCLPIVVQIPVFIALYWVLLESVELRQAPFIFWIRDLSIKDPYFVLPLIMGVSMFIQQKLNPAPPDPMQAKIMMSLPFVFTIFFAFFPSGLVLYWVTNNVLSIAQQWYITRQIEKAG